MKTLLLIFVPNFLLFLTSVEATGSGSTIAISYSTGTVCGILAGVNPRAVLCARGTELVPVLPNVSFDAISGGRDFFCGLRSGGNSLFCWNPTSSAFSTAPLLPRRLYQNTVALTELSVGETHVSAERNDTMVDFWRGRPHFPNSVSGNYESLTSGNGFTCGISTNDRRVRCWGGGSGGIGEQMERGFSNSTLVTIFAGDSRVCGINTAGIVICRGNNGSLQLGSELGSSPFEFSSLALGQTSTCATRTADKSVVCLGDGGDRYNPIGNVSVEIIVAGGNFTCALISQNLSVVCWGLQNSTETISVLPLPRVLPGMCTNRNSCPFGVLPESQSLCSNSGVICQRGDPSVPQAPASSPVPPVVPTSRRSRGFLAFVIVGSVGSFIGICALVYWILIRACKQKKVHNSVQPTIAGSSSGRRSNSPPTAAPRLVSILSSSLRSRSKSLVFHREEARIMNRQRSGPSFVKHTDRAEEFTFQALVEATDNFAPNTKIGGGSFGMVYRGKLPDGHEVAIKRSETSPRAQRVFQEKESAFRSELEFLSRLHHKHLVGFVGFCEEADERLLVYEFMKNGALYDHLHSTTKAGVLNSWRLRIKILLDAARGIEYLHNYAVPPIIHRDIKSSNILIDGNWTGRVSDFGLSLTGPDLENSHLSAKAAGTVGYIDPEYYGLHHLTTKSDVYGLGVVMLEVLTGKKAIFKDSEGTPTSVVEYAVPKMTGGVEEVIDTRVVGKAGEMEAVELVAYTAMHCVRLEGKDRPSINDVVANLETALAICDAAGGRVGSGRESREDSSSNSQTSIG